MANKVIVLDGGRLDGLSGTTDGDYLRWNAAGSEWQSQAGTGGGGVSDVTASAPLNSSGGATPNITLSAGSNAQILISNGSAYSSQTVSGDATITNTGSVTVTGLQGYDVSNAAPANNQLLVWNSTANAWVPGASAQGGSGGGGVLWYLNYQTAGASPTTGLTNAKQVGPIATDTANTLTSADLSTTAYDLIATFVTNVGYPGITDIPAGLWDFNFWASSSATVTNQTIVQIQVYKYNGTTATLLATSDDIYIYDPSVTAQYIGNVTFAQTTILDTDRIVIELRAKATQNNKTVTFNFGGNTPAHLHTTIPSVAGTGLVKVVSGVFQTPASTLVDADVASNADIAVSKLDNGSSGQILVAGASVLAYQTMGGDATINASGSLTLANSGVTANTYGSASVVPVMTVDAKGRVTGVTDTSIAIAASQVTSGTLGVARGGTGASTLTNNGVLIGQGTSAITAATLTDGQVLIGSSGGTPVAANITGTTNQITVSNGAGTIGLSLPQDIATTSSPTFSGLTLTGINASGSNGTTIGNATNGSSITVSASNGQSITVGGASTQTVNVGTTGTGAVTVGNSGATTAVAGSTVGVTSAAVSVNTTGTGTTTIGNTTNGGAINVRTAKAEALTVSPGSVSLTCATQSTAGVAGGSVTISAALSDFVTGGNVTVSGGNGPTAGNISLLAGDSNTGGGSGGAITLTTGDGYASSGPCPSGDVTIQTGTGGFQSNAGSISILGGTGYNTTTSEATGNITIRAGQNTYGQASRTSGTVTIQGGCDLTGVSATIAGYVRIRGGDMSNATGGNTAGLVEIRGGNNTATGVSGSNGGNVSITGGSGRLGGQVTITAGQSSTGTSAGYVLIRGSTAGSANNNALLGGVSIQGGRATGGFTVNVGASTTDYVNIGNSTGGGTYAGGPVVVGGFLCFTSTSQTMTAAADFSPLTSYLRIDSAGALSVSGNFSGTYPDGAYLLIRNVGSFSITIPATGSIRTLTNGAKVLAVGGTITVQYDATIGAWYECATVLNAS